MEDRNIAPGERTALVWQVEAAVAGVLALLAIVVMADSWRVGSGWGAEGPQAGFFPFYVGAILLVSALVTLVGALRPAGRDDSSFVDRTALRSVLAVLIPAIVYVAATKFLGIYVTSAALILFFMRTYGRHRMVTSIATALGISVALFVLFELWFLVPLPKGPIETALGY